MKFTVIFLGFCFLSCFTARSQGPNIFSIRDEDSVLLRLSYSLIGNKGDTLVAKDGKVEIPSGLNSEYYKLKFKARIMIGYDISCLFVRPKGRISDDAVPTNNLTRDCLCKFQCLYLRTRANNLNSGD